MEDGDVRLVIVTDLTSERRREQLLAEGRRKDEFLAMLAHELRNPIAPIRNAVQVLARRRDPDAAPGRPAAQPLSLSR